MGRRAPGGPLLDAGPAGGAGRAAGCGALPCAVCASAGVDRAIWAEVPRPEAGRRHQRGLPAPAPGAVRGAAAAGADPGLAGRRLQAVRCAHRARRLRVRPRGAGEHRPPRADPGVPGALPRVPPAQDQPGEFARRWKAASAPRRARLM